MSKGFYWIVFLTVLLGACTDPQPPSAPANLKASLTTFKSRAEWQKLLQWDETCEQAYQATTVTDEPGVEVYALGGKSQLVRVLCAVGSYQPSFLLYQLNAAKPALLSLETYSINDEQYLQHSLQTELWGEIAVKADRQTLVIVSAARQTKDCGIWVEYQLNEESLTLQSVYGKLPCPMELVGSPVSPDDPQPPADWKRLN